MDIAEIDAVKHRTHMILNLLRLQARAIVALLDFRDRASASQRVRLAVMTSRSVVLIAAVAAIAVAHPDLRGWLVLFWCLDKALRTHAEHRSLSKIAAIMDARGSQEP